MTTDPRLVRVLTAARSALAFNDGADGITPDERRLLSADAVKRHRADRQTSVFNELDAALDALNADYD